MRAISICTLSLWLLGSVTVGAEPANTTWTKKLDDRVKRGMLQDQLQTIRGDSGKWNDDAQLLLAPPLQQKPSNVSLDDWFDQCLEKKLPPTSSNDHWLLFRTRQLDDNDRVWIEQIERRGNEFTVTMNDAAWQGRYFKNFTYYQTFGVNMGKLEPGQYEAKWVVKPLAFEKFDGNGKPLDNWPAEQRAADQDPVVMRVSFAIAAPPKNDAESKNDAQSKSGETLRALLRQVDALIDKSDLAGAIETIQSGENPTEVMNRYLAVVNHLYRNRHDVSQMLAVGQAAMKYALTRAAAIEKEDAAAAENLKGLAKTVAYNIASNAWPGWNEPDVKITPRDLASALDAARENLRLGVELKRPPHALGNAYWLLGVQHLASGQPDAAIAQLQKAIAEFALAKKEDYQIMSEGYVGIARLTQSKSQAEGRRQVDDAIDRLEKLNTDDAKFFADQLKSVEQVFVSTAGEASAGGKDQ